MASGCSLVPVGTLAMGGSVVHSDVPWWQIRAQAYVWPLDPGHGHQHRPGCDRTMDPDMALSSSPSSDGTPTAGWPSDTSMAPGGVPDTGLLPSPQW